MIGGFNIDNSTCKPQIAKIKLSQIKYKHYTCTLLTNIIHVHVHLPYRNELLLCS